MKYGPLKTAAAIVGLLTGIVAAVYVLGGLTVALRLFFEHFHQDEVVNAVGQLPRETVIATALLSVIGVAVLAGLFAAMVYGLADRPRPRGADRKPALTPEQQLREDRLTSGPKWRVGLLFVVFLAFAVIGSLPALKNAIGAEETSRMLVPCLVAVVLTYGVLTAGWHLIRRIARRGLSRGEKALAAGAVWAAIAMIPALMFAATKPFVSAQVCTTGEQLPVKGKLIGDSSSSVFLIEEFGEEAAIVALPARQVTKSEYGDLSSTFACPQTPGQKVAAKVAEVALDGHGSQTEVQLATELRPRLLFDRSEPWRPLEVGAFIAEDFSGAGGHEACSWFRQRRESSCAAADLEKLRPGLRAPDYLDIHGVDEKDGTDYGSEDPLCHSEKPLAVDCNSGPRSVIYYRRTTHEGRWYWDYWWLLRFNLYTGPLHDCNPVNCSNHEGDWEGVTVITTPTLHPQVIGTIYAAHRNRILGEGDEIPLAGGRPLVFVASGTHASYPYRCSAGCKQYAKLGGTVRLPEDPHDGSVPWGGNADADCLSVECVRPLPEVEPANDLALPLAGSWAGWRGLWGQTCHEGCSWPLVQGSPRSPGLQIRFECPWAVTDRAEPAADGSGLSRSEEVGDAERIFARCRAQRGGERGL